MVFVFPLLRCPIFRLVILLPLAVVKQAGRYQTAPSNLLRQNREVRASPVVEVKKSNAPDRLLAAMAFPVAAVSHLPLRMNRLVLLMNIGPGARELERLHDFLAAIFHREPAVKPVVLIDGCLEPRHLEKGFV